MAKNETYEEFINKFKPKLTTDDCYTPPEIYEAVLDWATKEYDLEGKTVIRPFYPGGDYTTVEYGDAVVVDNPPFSILSEIVKFYDTNRIPFLLFVPGQMFRRFPPSCTMLMTGSRIVYENGAVVLTDFLTNLDDPDIFARTVPDLTEELEKIVKKLRKKQTKTVRKLAFPAEILTAAMLDKYAHYGIYMEIPRRECRQVSRVSAVKREIYGTGLLVSERLAAERLAAERLAAERLAAKRLAAERLAAERLPLTDSELAIVKELSQ